MKKKLNPIAQATFDAFCLEWREAKRHDHDTFIRAWENAAAAAIGKWEESKRNEP